MPRCRLQLPFPWIPGLVPHLPPGREALLVSRRDCCDYYWQLREYRHDPFGGRAANVSFHLTGRYRVSNFHGLDMSVADRLTGEQRWRYCRLRLPVHWTSSDHHVSGDSFTPLHVHAPNLILLTSIFVLLIGGEFYFSAA